MKLQPIRNPIATVDCDFVSTYRPPVVKRMYRTAVSITLKPALEVDETESDVMTKHKVGMALKPRRVVSTFGLSARI